LHEGKELYEFTDFRLDISERLLLRKGKPVSLSEKAFRILCLLVRENGHLVGKDRLLSEVWADSVVEENNLDKNVSLLRQILGERKGREKFIETVRGHGYRFVAEVRRPEAAEVEKPSLGKRKKNRSSKSPSPAFSAASFGSALPSNNVVALADWRHEPDKKPIEEISETSPNTETRLSARKKIPPAAFIVLGLAILALGYFALTRFRSEPPNGAAPITTLAVLLFQNDSGDADLDYLAEGLSESLIDKLSQLPQLKVIARSSSFKYRGENIDLQGVAQKLNVRVIVTGKVMRRGDQLTIRVEMVDAIDNKQVWGEQYKRPAADLLLLEKEITQTVSQKLRLKLSGAKENQFARQDTVNPRAYELLLKGQFLYRTAETENQKKAVEYYQQAIALDPNYALAYVKLSKAYQNLLGKSTIDPQEFTPKARAAAQKALELDENLAEAHLAAAIFHLEKWDWAAYRQNLERAIELSPNSAEAHSSYAHYLSMAGRHEEALVEARRARELDPLTIFRRTQISQTLAVARRDDEAFREINEALELDANNIFANIGLGWLYQVNGMYREAIAAFQESIRLGDNSQDVQIYLGTAYAQAGERDKARAILRQLETSKIYVSPCELAYLYAALGEREKAFASLEKAYADKDLHLMNMNIDRNFDPLRADPRFDALLRRIGLAQ
jgi:TolB-like protein/DNA-binding winged helix-turn-helix (wHTH) protein/Tfp pilus assembly protein PilF